MANYWEAFKWLLFRGLERLLSIRDGQQPPLPTVYNSRAGTRYIWVYCASIGELHGCKPLINYLASQGQLVLLTDRRCYRQAYLALYPEAIMVELGGGCNEGRYLVELFLPDRLVICEIPGLMHDAPCRLSYGLLRAVKRAQGDIYLVNGWLYDQRPSCRMDQLEHGLFAKEYLLSFDFLMVQTQAVMERFLTAGYPAERIRVTGNMKFDSLGNARSVAHDASASALLDILAHSPRHIVVAGCLASLKEVAWLIECHEILRRQFPDALLILAPRYPDNSDFMAALAQQLRDSPMPCQYRSRWHAHALAETAVMVLDTIGELKSFYSVADVCYVGTNHNVLEPLCFAKPVVVSTGWEPSYPSYPVYQLARGHQLVDEVDGCEALLAQLMAALAPLTGQRGVDAARQLGHLQGATLKNLRLLGYHLSDIPEASALF